MPVMVFVQVGLYATARGGSIPAFVTFGLSYRASYFPEKDANAISYICGSIILPRKIRRAASQQFLLAYGASIKHIK